MVHRNFAVNYLLAAALMLPPLGVAAPAPPRAPFTLQQVLSYPFAQDLTAASHGDRIAWVINLRGVRNVWVAEAPDFRPRQVTNFTRDDGQEITQLTFSPDGDELVFVRGGDHDANWPVKVAPDPASSPVEPQVMLWDVDLRDGTSRVLAEGDAPALSSSGELAYIKDNQVWTASLAANTTIPPRRLFFDHGEDSDLQWSPDGQQLAFVSNRGDHAFIGVFTNDRTPLRYLAPSTAIDGDPRWSPDGADIAFTRQPGIGGPPQSILNPPPHPWSIWVANTRSGQGRDVWNASGSHSGFFGQAPAEANLHWADRGIRLVFKADTDGWPHLYSIPATGGAPLLLTPGQFMVQDATMTHDGNAIIYSANTGPSHEDIDRRHLFEVPNDRAAPVELTSGAGIETAPVAAGPSAIAYIEAGSQRPPLVAVSDASGHGHRVLQAELVPADFPTAELVVPKLVTFRAADGTLVYGQLFRSANAGTDEPGVIFVHGGPPRQMLLGWHPMGPYSYMYAVNQYLATHGFTILSVNYRLSIGHGYAFANPPHWGPTGASEYQDVVAGAKFLQGVPGVDPSRIGIWGASYGGYLTALALARNSNLFKAGVDQKGISDWLPALRIFYGNAETSPEQGDRKRALKIAWESSPDASMSMWKSPVLVIQGDDDHNVHFAQMEDLIARLHAHHVPFREIVLPNEVHGFLRYASLFKQAQATVDFLQRKLAAAAR